MCLRKHCARIVNKLERLSQYEAVECIGGKRIVCRKVANDCRSRIMSIDIQHLTPLDPYSEAVGVIVVFNLKDTAMNIAAMLIQKVLDVIAINRRPSIKAPPVTYRVGCPNCA